MDQRRRTVRRDAADEALARRHPVLTLHGWTMVRYGGALTGLVILAHWTGIL